MHTRIQKWGNCLALRIPKAFTISANIQENTPVELSLDNEKLVITPILKKKYSLADMLKGISDENLHNEIDFGSACGKEVM